MSDAYIVRLTSDTVTTDLMTQTVKRERAWYVEGPNERVGPFTDHLFAQDMCAALNRRGVRELRPSNVVGYALVY